jgi:PIN domain nuclease of toxin-antitoxin system
VKGHPRKILADTHAILWWLAGDERLSKRARRILEDPANQRWVSMASLWEIAIKMSSGRLPAEGLTLRAIAELLKDQQFVLLPVRLEDLLRMEMLPWHHRDPFDRLLIAQAMEEGLPLLTADGAMGRYAVETVW